jgi:hypothetical protein
VFSVISVVRIFPLWPRITQTTAGLIQRRAQSLPSSIILHLSSVLRALCAFVVRIFPPRPKVVTQLPKSVTRVHETRTPLSKTRIPLSKSRAPLSESRTPLSESRTPLSETRTPLPKSLTPLSKTRTTVSRDALPAVFRLLTLAP